MKTKKASDLPAMLSRRNFLHGALGVGAIAGMDLAASAAPGEAVASRSVDRDRIRAENNREGTLDWQLTFMRTDPKSGNFRSRLIEGYASQMSVRPAESIDLMVSTQPASAFEIDIYRMGYYQGLGGRHVTHLGPFQVQTE